MNEATIRAAIGEWLMKGTPPALRFMGPMLPREFDEDDFDDLAHDLAEALGKDGP